MSNEVTYGAEMRAYLENQWEYARACEAIEELKTKKIRLESEERRLREFLKESVQPICGSATKPFIRTFTNGRYETITVVWDYILGHGRVTITTNEKEGT